MPLYDYKCSRCQHEFETMRSLTNEVIQDPVKCPSCGGCYADRMPVGTKSYTIKGDNSASITPKRHRA